MFRVDVSLFSYFPSFLSLSYGRYSQMKSIHRMIANARRDRIFSPDGIDPEVEDQV